MLTRLVGPASRVARAGTRRYHDTKPFKYASLDEAPMPSGSWQEYYDKRQKLYTMQLIGGIAFFLATFTYGKTSGCFYLNYYPPVMDKKECE